MALATAYEVHDNLLIIRLEGELDHHEADKLRKEWQWWLKEKRKRHVLLELSGLDFMDSSGLGVVLGRYKEIQANEGMLMISGVSSEVDRLFELSGLKKLLPFAVTEEEALQKFGVMI
ncbi:anti-sigma F factor antagonist [Salimicrobium halophilum]|uniref:Anti-sigma F factor antagonist n=1 Tax=Salimicrobium halophilum TaxID=86666 RepID=A0A1G8PXD9_9BACI|nr:anti-sigma F factor antagonist [Salimicrobium halophilum]SDI97103.1 anti-anti-sigma regulatory factor, SpoIIAA [Salimicrobium halophilum]